MTPSAIPIRWLQDQQIGAPRECQKECRSVADPAASWNIIQEDGSRRQTSFSQEMAKSSPSAVTGRPLREPQDIGPEGTARNAPSEAGNKLPENSGEAQGASGTTLGIRIGFPTAKSGLSSGKWVDGGTKSPRFLSLRLVQRASQGQAAQPVGKASGALSKGGISATELLAWVPGKSLGLSFQESAGRTRRGKVEMPSARPTLEDEPGDPENVLEKLMLSEGQSKPSRMPGVDRRRPFEPVPIEPPIPQPPQLPLENKELLGTFSGRVGSSAKPAPGRIDPQLRRLMEAWPAVPQHTREAILALIDGALGGK